MSLPFSAVTELGLGGLQQMPQSGVSGGTAVTGSFFSRGAMQTPDTGLNVSGNVGVGVSPMLLVAGMGLLLAMMWRK